MDTNGVWVLIMHATRARILRVINHHRSQPAELVLRSRQWRLRAMLASGGESEPHWPASNRAATHCSWHEMVAQDEGAFAEQVAAFLEAHRLAGDYSRLAIFGTPAVIAQLRKVMPPSLRRLIVAEVGLNLIMLPEAELQERVAANLKAL